ncbi:MAG: hypothetical protein AAGF11_55035 [Myxococcota bacterium]
MPSSRSCYLPSLCLALTLAACGPGIEPTSPLDERCGQPEPTQLLALEPDQIVPFDRSAVVPYGDRWLVAVSTLQRDFDGMFPRDDEIVQSRVISIDACGTEQPHLIAEGIDMVLPPKEPDLPWMGCDSVSNRMFLIDPEGEVPPTELGMMDSCHLRQEVPGAIWLKRIVSDQDAQLLRVSSFEGLAMVETSIETVVEHVSPALRSHTTEGDMIWFVTTDGELFEYDHSTRDGVLLAEGVGTVSGTSSGFLAWSDEPESFSAGQWTVYDRENGTQIPVEISGQDQVRFMGSILFSFTFQATHDDGTSELLVMRLPSLESTSVRGPWAIVAETGPGDLILRENEPTGSLYILRSGTEQPELLVDSYTPLVRVDDDDLWVWDYYDHESGLVQDNSTRLVRIPLGGGEPETIVDDVYQPLALDDGRWLTVRGYAGDGRGELRVVDPHAGTEQVVDRDVSVWFSRYNDTPDEFFGFGARPSDATFVYSVHDGGARNGLWSARLTSAPTGDAATPR